MSFSNYSNGITSMGVPILGGSIPTTTGAYYFVDSNTGSDGNSGSDKDNAVATIAKAFDKVTASKGDVILLMPGHAETLTAAIDGFDVAGVTVYGLGYGNLRPTLTGNGTIDVIDVSAANITIANILFAAPSTDAQTADINVGAAGCTILNTEHVGSATSKNKVDIITLTSAANNCLIDGVRVRNTVVEVVAGIAFEGQCSNVEIRNCYVFDSIGFTNGALADETTVTNLYVHNNVFKNAKAGTVVLDFATGNSTGACSFNHISGRHTTLASNVGAGTGMDFFENRVVEQAAVNGAIIPGADTD